MVWGASLLVHAGLAGIVTVVAYYSLAQREAEERARRQAAATEPIPIDLPPVAEGDVTNDGVVDRRGDEPIVTGGASVARLDDGKAGRGGDATSAIAATNLSDRDERLHLSPDTVSHLDRDQIQRLKTARTRASWEDRRATTNPMELTFLATGPGDRAERRSAFASDPSRGAKSSTLAVKLGGTPGSSETDDGFKARGPRGSNEQGTTQSTPGLGVHDGRVGVDHHAAAAITSARPDVTLGPVTIPATDHARPRDDVDSDQAVATTLQSIVHGSYAGGVAGDGRGGAGGGGVAAAGGAQGAGSHAAPLGLGEGELYDLQTSDPRLLPYFRKIHARIEPFWQNAFPRSAMLELKQGTVILEFEVRRDGTATVKWPPLRPSGIDEFDRNCAEAIRRAAPFEPIPPELGVAKLRIRAPFVASNPVVK
jgi:TonB family protein